jgi:hypothetical protein
MINTYDIGDVVTVTAIYSTLPETLSLIVNPPSGTVVQYQYASPEAEITLAGDTYTAEIDANAAGTWYYEWKSTGTGQAAEQGQFVVRNTNAPEPTA